jgi:hypothetical protein
MMALSLLLAIFLMSCRNEPQTPEEKAERLIEEGEVTKEKEDKVKLESPDGSETKIKYDEEGNVEKIKTDDN